jgi:predicted NUDIX family phosphoesterase
VIIQQKERFYLLRRLNKQMETRLHDRLSLGIGGHINPVEEQNEVFPIIEAGMYRELNEEVSIEKIVDLKCVGILNDTSGGVSDYHLGVVYLLQAEGDVYVRETEKMEGTWAMLPELESAFQQLETWSQIVVEKLLRFVGVEFVEMHKRD